MDYLLNCPFCGNEMDINDRDVVYPTGYVKVKLQNSSRVALKCLRDIPVESLPSKEYWEYGIYCSEHNGGCGAGIEGGNREKVIKKWNTRTI